MLTCHLYLVNTRYVCVLRMVNLHEMFQRLFQQFCRCNVNIRLRERNAKNHEMVACRTATVITAPYLVKLTIAVLIWEIYAEGIVFPAFKLQHPLLVIIQPCALDGELTAYAIAVLHGDAYGVT